MFFNIKFSNQLIDNIEFSKKQNVIYSKLHVKHNQFSRISYKLEILLMQIRTQMSFTD